MWNPSSNMKLESISQEDTIMAECIWCSEYRTNKKNPCMSSGSCCSHLCSSRRRRKNPLDISINIKVIFTKKIASTDQRSKKAQFWWMTPTIEWVLLQSNEMMSGMLLPLLVMTPVSLLLLDELTWVVLSWGLVVVTDVLLAVKGEVRLSKNIGGQYCLKQTMMPMRKRLYWF